MTTTATSETLDHDAVAGALAERIIGAVGSTMLLYSLYLGDKLGWYRALAGGQPVTAAALAAATSTDERYAREWLEQQVAVGIVTLGEDGTFRLPAPHAEVLTDELSLAYVAPFARFVAGQGRLLDQLVQAYRTGAGLAWADMGADAREGQAATNRPYFLKVLGQQDLPGVPELHERLSAPGARAADVGCGFGWSTIGMALAYPELRLDGIDVDGPSIEAARRNAIEAGVADRVKFHHGDAAGVAALAPGYDAVFAFECIHDLSDPVAVLSSMRQLAAVDGLVVVMDERVADTLTGPTDEVEQIMYGFSLVCCLPDGRAHGHPSAATGTVMRPSTLQTYAEAAGLDRFEILPIENDFFRFYRLQ